MARSPRRLGEQVSVDELLKETGERARQRSETADGTDLILPARELPDGEDHRERLERQARTAAQDEQRAGTNLQRVTALAAGVIVLVTLVVLAVLAASPGTAPASLSFGPLQPATGAPSLPPGPTKTPAPSPKPVPPPAAATMSASESTSAAPPPPPPPPSPPCAVQFTLTASWPGGFTASVSITNMGDQPLSPWTLSWNWPAGQQVTQGWDGTYSQSGSRVTVTPASWNETIASGATLNTGFNGSFGRSNPAPSSFTLNGNACSAA